MDPLASHEVFLTPTCSKSDVLLFMESTNWYHSIYSKDSKHLKPFLMQVASKLNEPSSRLDGLLMLKSVIIQASHQCFIENYQTWVQHLKKIIFIDPDVRYRCLAIQMFGEILKSASQFRDEKVFFSVELIPQFLHHLLGLNETDDVVVAYGLLNMLKYTPGPCSQHSFAIRKRLLEMLCVKDPTIIEISSSCISLLPFINHGTDREKTQNSAWLELYDKCCLSLHLEFNVLYENLEIDQRVISSNDVLQFPSILKCLDPTLICVDSYHRAMSILCCIKKLLRTGADVKMTIPVEATLNLVKRIMGVTSISLIKKGDFEGSAHFLHSVLPFFHREALQLLETLILSCRQHLLLHDEAVLNLVLHTLQWTRAFQLQQENKHSLSLLRNVAYQVLITWLSVVGSATDFSHFGGALVKQHLQDAVVEDNKCELTSLKPPSSTNCNPKVKRQRLGESFLQSQQRKPRSYLNTETCYLALKSLRIILQSSCEELKSETLKELDSFVITTLLKLQRCKHDDVSPYNDIQCRSGLLKLLTTMVLLPSLATQAFLSQSMYIFSRGQMDSSPKVSKICSQGLAICRSVIDPVRRCLNVCQHPGREIVQKSDAESDHETESYVQDVCVSDSSEDPNPKIQNSHAAEQSLKRKDTNSKDLVVDGTDIEKTPTCSIPENVRSLSSTVGSEIQPIQDDLASSQLECVPLSNISVVECNDEVCEMAEMTIANENDVAEMKAKSPINENQTLNDNGNDHDKALSKQNEFETSGDVGTVEGHSVEAMLKTFVTRPPDENDLT